MSMSIKVCVVGAGVVGLTTALQIQQSIPNVQVTVLADKWEEETTSYGAGGLFRMTRHHAPGNDIKLLRQWSSDAWDYWHKMSLREEGPKMGIIPVSLYNVSRQYTPRQLFAEFCFSYQEMSREQARHFGSQYNHGYIAGTVTTDCSKYLPWLKEQLLAHGGVCIKQKVKSLSEISEQYDLIVNCTGLGSRWLVDDPLIYPVRGETVKVHAPWIKHCYMEESGENTYIIVLTDCVVIGGTRQKNDYDLKVRDGQDTDILERAIKLYPPLKGAKVIKRWVGLRPYRQPIRIEREDKVIDGRKVKIVHHYGHGGFGVCLSWGTAIHATRLVQEALGVSSNLITPPSARL